MLFKRSEFQKIFENNIEVNCFQKLKNSCWKFFCKFNVNVIVI